MTYVLWNGPLQPREGGGYEPAPVTSAQSIIIGDHLMPRPEPVVLEYVEDVD